VSCDSPKNYSKRGWAVRTLGKILDHAITQMLPLLLAILWPLSYFHRVITPADSCKRVLLVARNHVAADHMICIHDLLKKDDRIIQFATTDRVPARDFHRGKAADVTGAKPMHMMRALLCHWDLIIFTNHPYGFGICFAPWLKKLYVNHGIHTGKINTEIAQDGVYGRGKVIRPFGTPYYNCMFAASAWEKKFAIRETPQLKGRVAVVGFLRGDIFLDYAEKHSSGLREKFGCKSDMPVVHIISTWGASSLYAICGEEIIGQVKKLSDKYQFLVSIHPRFDDLGHGAFEAREIILSRFEEAGARVNRGLDWEDYVAVSDIAISDHSSLCLYHVLAGHPVIFSDVCRDNYVAGSTFDLLGQCSPKLSEYDGLDEAISDALGNDSRNNNTTIATRILDFRGSASEMYVQEITVLLNTPG